MSRFHPSRREFIKTTAVIGAGYYIGNTATRAADSTSPNEKIRWACIGVGGKGSSDTKDASNNGDIAAIIDIDDKTLDKAANAYPNAKKFNDWRKMLDECGKDIDAVTVSTPDHSHAAAAATAMRMGKAAFVQKPLTHSIYEARTLGNIAREQKVASQMGNQGTAANELREGAAQIKAGAIGNLKEIHVWTNRPIWPQGGDRGKEVPTPEHVHWDLFLGPAPYRPYAGGYHPFSWRGWWDFGTGALGDMACHTVNLPFMGCDLRDPVSVQAETSGHNRDSYPKWSMITFEFAATDKRPAIKLFWYDGGKKPSPELLDGEKILQSGALVIGDKGKLYSVHDYGGKYTLLGGAEKKDVEFTKSPGHFKELADAIKGGPPAMSNFPDYAGPLTETILLGNLAVWAAPEAGSPGKKIEWDSKNLTAKNAPEVAEVIKPTYRDGYSL